MTYLKLVHKLRFINGHVHLHDLWQMIFYFWMSKVYLDWPLNCKGKTKKFARTFESRSKETKSGDLWQFKWLFYFTIALGLNHCFEQFYSVTFQPFNRNKPLLDLAVVAILRWLAESCTGCVPHICTRVFGPSLHVCPCQPGKEHCWQATEEVGTSDHLWT